MNDKEYKEKFIKLGLSDQFDFIGRDYSSYRGRKIIVRCRECGAEFSTWAFNEILKSRQSHLLCSKCGISSDGADVWNRSPQCEEAMAYYVQGHSVKETAEHFNVSKIQINNAVKVRGLTNGRDFREAGIESARKRGEQNRQKSEIEKLKAKAEREAVRIAEREKRKEERRLQRERRVVERERVRQEREAEKRAKNPLGLSEYQLSQRAKLDDSSVCKVCGEEYTLREYMESTGIKYYRNSGYCSVECRRKWQNRIVHRSRKIRKVPENHRRRARYYGCEYDPSVTLKRLIERDGLRCAICGEMCDQNDHRWSKYTGPLSPSIDHIIPMAKGGGHIWNNVQVVHMICNSNKGDNLGVV